MRIYYMEIINGIINLYAVNMSERATFWKEHPAAMEINFKQYNGLIDHLNKMKNETQPD